MDKISASIKSGRSSKTSRKVFRQPRNPLLASGKRSARTGKPATSHPALAVPPPGQGKRGEQGYLAYLLRQAQAAARLTLERSLGELGVTPPQFIVLTMLKAYPGLSGADLGRVALLTPQTVGVIIRNLERDGAVQKTPHPVHGRVLQWALTRRGLTLLEKCRRPVMVLERRLAAGLDAQALAAIRHWLAKIATDLQNS
jgi:DNA-binding MarR family transcriptional regulator